MGKRAPRLPVASAERIKVTVTDNDWQRIEKAYGQKLSPKARRDIHEKTQEFVDRAEFEQNAEPVSDARDRITTILGAASSLRSAIHSGIHDADIYACSLIKKHLWKQSDAEKQKEGDAIKRRRRKKDDPLRNISSGVRLLIFASQDALRELDDVKDQGFSKGEAWERWIVRLTSIAEKHGLPWRTAIRNPAVPPLLSWSGNYNSPCRRHIADPQGARWPGPLWEPAGKIGSDSRPAAACKKPAIISGYAG